MAKEHGAGRNERGTGAVRDDSTESTVEIIGPVHALRSSWIQRLRRLRRLAPRECVDLARPVQSIPIRVTRGAPLSISSRLPLSSREKLSARSRHRQVARGGDQPEADWITAGRHDNRDARRRILRGPAARLPAVTITSTLRRTSRPPTWAVDRVARLPIAPRKRRSAPRRIRVPEALRTPPRRVGARRRFQIPNAV